MCYWCCLEYDSSIAELESQKHCEISWIFKDKDSPSHNPRVSQPHFFVGKIWLQRYLYSLLENLCFLFFWFHIGTWRMAHLRTLSSLINLGLFQNHWLLFTLLRFASVLTVHFYLLGVKVCSGLLIHHETGFRRLGLSTWTGCDPSGY